MRVLYRGWNWGKATKYKSAHDGHTKVRVPEDVTLSQVLNIFFTHASFTVPLRRIIDEGLGDGAVSDHDILMFLKV
jgi:hypothetical protein